MIEGWYYLHTNGELIYKRELGGTAADIRESDFARAMWPLDTTDREGAWRILVESSALGANPARIQELADKWRCNSEDSENYAERIGCNLWLDGNMWCAALPSFVNLQESPTGFGDTELLAMADLAKTLGFRASKMWGASLKDLLQNIASAEHAR